MVLTYQEVVAYLLVKCINGLKYGFISFIQVLYNKCYFTSRCFDYVITINIGDIQKEREKQWAKRSVNVIQ